VGGDGRVEWSRLRAIVNDGPVPLGGVGMDKTQRAKWNELMEAWESQRHAVRRVLARRYTHDYPKDFCGWIVLGDISGGLRQFAEARAALRTALKLAPRKHRANVYVQFGHLYREMGNDRRAAMWYERAATGLPRTSTITILGACYARLGDLNKSERCHRRAIKLASELPDEAYFNLGLVLRAEERYEEALACFTEAVKLDPKYRAAMVARDDVVAVMKLLGG